MSSTSLLKSSTNARSSAFPTGHRTTQLRHVERQNGLCDAAGIEGIGLADAAVGPRVHPSSLCDGVSRVGCGTGQAGAVGAYSLDNPQGVQVTTGAASNPVDSAQESCASCWELSLIEDLASGTGQDGQGVIAGVGINADDERVGVSDHRHG